MVGVLALGDSWMTQMVEATGASADDERTSWGLVSVSVERCGRDRVCVRSGKDV